uniref:Exostosin GT47 domain-containing protein n=1 Tax=viral metagenome TaxID=1070528 RepID=A0A6C0KRU3_9ZZZZ
MGNSLSIDPETGLNFRGFTSYMGLKYHMEEALLEKNLPTCQANPNPPIALFSKKYYNDINELNHNKIHDYCFIGSISSSEEYRKWVIEFAKKYFTHNSIFINTDNNDNWELLGSFDYSNLKLGFCPKNNEDNQSKKIQYRIINENIYYFEKMCQSKFVLCPAGDSSWSFRFYEVLMCKSLPIVDTWHHTYRTKEEADIKYKYILQDRIDEKEIQYEEYINENILLFEKYHMLN